MSHLENATAKIRELEAEVARVTAERDQLLAASDGRLAGDVRTIAGLTAELEESRAVAGRLARRIDELQK